MSRISLFKSLSFYLNICQQLHINELCVNGRHGNVCELQSASSVEIGAFSRILDNLNYALDSNAEGSLLVETWL